MSSIFSLSPSNSSSKKHRQQHQTSDRPASIHSTSSSKSISQYGRLASAWSTFSLDQLPFYHSTKRSDMRTNGSRRRLSDASSVSQFSINSQAASTTTGEEEAAVANRKLKYKAKVDEFMNGFMELFLLCLNDCSQGFYKIFDHIRRRVPNIVQQKVTVRDIGDKVNIAIADIKDLKENVMELERQIEPFRNMYDMIQTSIALAQTTDALPKPKDA